MDNIIEEDLYEEDYDEDYEEQNSEDESETINTDKEEEKNSEEEYELQDVVEGNDEKIDNITITSNSIIRNKLTKYEYTRIFSSRVTHIQNGAIPMVKVDNNMTVEDIVKREFEQGRIPLILERIIPKEKGFYKEYRHINDVFNIIS